MVDLTNLFPCKSSVVAIKESTNESDVAKASNYDVAKEDKGIADKKISDVVLRVFGTSHNWSTAGMQEVAST